MVNKVLAIILASILLTATACSSSIPLTPTVTTPVNELTLYNWAEYMPQSVLDAFGKEYGIKVNYIVYDTMEEAEQRIIDGNLAFDIAVVEHDSVARLVSHGSLAGIDYHNVPNFKNISADFRDLAFDPGNRYLVPYNWGTTGLIVRSDLVNPFPTRWADLWNPRYAGHIAIRAQPTELINVALKSLGYPLNSSDPAHLEQALRRLIELKKAATFVDVKAELAIAGLLTGDTWILLGWTGDALLAADQNPSMRYVIPQDGTLLWGDGFVISANSAHKDTAEKFINFILRPEISAQIVNEYYYPTANEAALGLVDPAIRNNPILFPAREDIRNGEWYQPLSPERQRLYDNIWARFEGAKP